MAADDRREGEVAVARERLTEIAAELARRAQPEYVKARAAEVADDLKVKAKVAARDKVDELKDRARDAAREKVQDVKEMAMTQNKGMGLLGAVIGGGLGFAVVKMLQDRAQTSGEYRGFGPYAGYREIGYGFEGGQGYQQGRIDELKTEASARFDQAKDKVSEVKERLSTQASELKEKVPSVDEVKMKMESAVESDPVVIGLGALAIGAIAGLLLPITDSERTAYSRVRVAAQQKLQEAGGVIQEKLQGMAEKMDSAGDQVRGAADMVGSATGSSQFESEETDIGGPSGEFSSTDANTPSVH